jgi:hypothetical protein
MTNIIEQFEAGEAWLAFPVKLRGEHYYFLVDIYSGYMYGHIAANDSRLDKKEVETAMKSAFNMKKFWPKTFFLPEGDPAEDFFKGILEDKKIPFDSKPMSDFKEVIAPFKQSFGV